MSKLKGFIWLCVFGLFAGAANADIVIDNQSIPSADVSGISISPASGHMYITTVPGYTITRVGSTSTNVAITDFSITPNVMNAGDTFTVSWTVANGASCVAGGGVGGWGFVNLTLPSGSADLTTTRLGVKTFTLTCYGASGDSDSASATLTINDPNAAPIVSITGFTASKTTLEVGETTTLNWSTLNATSCTPSGGAGGWSTAATGVNGSFTTAAIATAGSYTFTLTCKDAAANTAVKSIPVTVTPPPTACATPPLGSTGALAAWTGFWGANFPYAAGNVYATVPQYSYLAIEFNTGSVLASGKFTSVETTVTDGVRLGAISECPGDFDVVAECDYSWGIGGGLSWSTNGGAGCQLQPNTTYYFNLTYTNGTTAASTTCTSAPCITDLRHDILQ